MKTLLYLFFFLPILLFSSCDKSCDLLECGPNGECEDGACLCDLGYKGEFCETKYCSADIFVGTFEGDLQCNSSKERHYVVRFTKQSETEITVHGATSGDVSLELNNSNCVANGMRGSWVIKDVITATVVNQGIRFTHVSSNILGLNSGCTGILTK